MDAVEYLKAKARMTKRGDGAVCNISCKDCPIGIDNNGVETNCRKLESYYPKKTRQSEFLKTFPNAVMSEGVVGISPCAIDVSYGTQQDCTQHCRDCQIEYWLAEVDND